MDCVVDYRNFEVCRNVLCDTKWRQQIRLLNVFGCGGGEVIFVTNDDKVYGFGRNRFGGLGLGINEEQVPQPTLNVILSGKDVINFGIGFEHWLALTASGQCYSWGHNSSGQLGIGTVESTTAPELIETLNKKDVIDISCGGFFSLALTRNGQVYGWGDNRFGQLGDRTFEDALIPKRLGFNVQIVSIACGMKHSLAVSVTDQLYAWGVNNYGQLGRKNRDTDEINRPKIVPELEDVEVKAIVCGPHHSLVLSANGYVFTFGDNRVGQIGNGCLKSQKRPFLVSEEIQFKDIIAHKENDISIAVSIDNKYYIWGLANNRRYLTPKEVTSGDSIFNVYAKVVRKSVTFKTIVISNDLRNWERIDPNFVLNSNPIEETSSSLKTRESVVNSVRSSVRLLNSKQNNLTINDFLDLKDFTRYDLLSINNQIIKTIRLFFVYQRGQSVIYVTKEDKAYGLGFNRNGVLGLGFKKPENLRKPVLNSNLSGKQLVDIASGYEHCLALTSTGQCYSWGSNKYGELGIGTHEPKDIPQLIEEFNDTIVIQISCGAYHSMAVTSDGQLFSWGHNTFAQLGDETYNSRTTPIHVLIKDKVVSASCGGNHSLALTLSGFVYVWGCNEAGELGRPRDADFRGNRLKAMSKNPTRVTGFEDIVFSKALCGHKHTLLLSTDGDIYSFGDNTNGQIGNGTTDNQSFPYLLNKSTKFKDIITNWENDLLIAVSYDNNVYVWGLANNKKILLPKLIPKYGKSLFDIYLKLAVNKVTYKSLNTNEDIIDLKQITNILIQIQSNYDFNPIDDDLDDLNVCLNKGYRNLIPIEQRVENPMTYLDQFTEQNQQIVSLNGNHSKQSSESDCCSINTNAESIIGQEFLKHLKKSFNNQNNSDLKLVSEDKVIYIHKTVIKIRNEKFWQTLERNLTDNEIRINPNTFDTFYGFIQYIYGFKPNIDINFISDLEDMAKYFDEPELEYFCSQYVRQLKNRSNPTNVCLM